MNKLFSQLLDLQRLDLADESVRFAFERPLPAWAWAGVVLASCALAAWSYSRLTGGRVTRALLAGMRALLLVFLVVLIAGPQLVQKSVSVERDWVLVLIDRSLSLTIPDVSRAGSDGMNQPRRTREAQLRDAIGSSWPMWSELSRDRTVVWLGFDAGAFELDVQRGVGGSEGDTSARIESVDLGEPTGRRTSIGSALDQALARAAARPLSGVVIVSDGRSIDAPTRDAVRRLAAEKIPVHTVALGSADPVGDLAVRHIESPRLAFVGDVLPVHVDIEMAGAAPGHVSGHSSGFGATVRLIDTSTGLVLDEQRIEPENTPGTGDEGDTNDNSANARTQRVLLTVRPDAPGEHTWAVEVVPDGDDLIAGNNRSELTIELTDRPIRVLYIDGYPRWEQRYLRNLLLREKSIRCSTLMLAPDRRYTQEGDVILEMLPDSPEAWAEYDAVILGDVRPDVFTQEQIEQLREHISVRGAGLICIGGEGAMPASWFGTPLGDLLPFAKSAAPGVSVGEPVLMQPTRVADRLGVMRLGTDVDEPWPGMLTDASAGWSQLRWAQFIDARGIKPTAEIVATGETVFTNTSTPLVLTMRYGAGRVLYCATDEIWRWRYARGEVLFERFWVQFIRMLGREALARSGRQATLALSPDDAVVDQPVRVEVEVLDQALIDQSLGSITVQLERAPAAGDVSDTPLRAEVTLRPEQAGGRVYSALWHPPEAGRWSAEADEAALVGLGLSASVDVGFSDDELRRPEADHEALEALSARTGGRMFSPGTLGELPAYLRDRRLRLVNEATESLWDTPLALTLVILLLSAEWIGRRLIRLI